MSQSILQMSARHNAVHLGFLWFPSTLPQFVQPLLPLAGCSSPVTSPQHCPTAQKPPKTTWEAKMLQDAFLVPSRYGEEQRGNGNTSFGVGRFRLDS